MLDIIRKQIDRDLNREEQISQLREFMQILVLKIIYDLGGFKNLVFTGGAALRIIYALKRYSEDLGFSLINKAGYSFVHLCKEIEKQLTRDYGFGLSLACDERRAVQTIDLKFERLLFDLSLSEHKTQKLYIKMEVDSNPPAGGKTEISLISRSFVFTVTHFDLPSLFATKLHACFFRKYTKGRDLYDLIWYLGKNLMPNFELLNNAIKQTQGESPKIDAKNLKDFLIEHLGKIDYHLARKDVERFLIDKSELKLFDRELLLKVANSKFPHNY